MQELTKKEKKIARDIFSASIEKEFDVALQNAEMTIAKWKNCQETGRKVFHEMRNYLNDFFKHLQRRYDDLRPSDYLITLVGILKEGFITDEQVKDFSEEAKETIMRHKNFIE